LLIVTLIFYNKIYVFINLLQLIHGFPFDRLTVTINLPIPSAFTGPIGVITRMGPHPAIAILQPAPPSIRNARSRSINVDLLYPSDR
jgi:hypothetical protein